MDTAGRRPLFPASPWHLVEYTTHMLNKGYAAASIATALAAIGYVHKMAGLDDPTATFLVKKAIIGAHRLRNTVDERRPISMDLLHEMIRATESIGLNKYNKSMMKAVLLLMFHGLFRLGELIQSDSRNSQTVIQLNNVRLNQRANKFSSMTIRISNFKHNTPSNTIEIKILSKRNFCPVNHLISYLTVRGNANGPLFLRQDGAPLTRSVFTTVFRNILQHLKLSPAEYKPHGFRIGGTTHLAELGYEEALIQRMGRWKSNAFRKYIRMPKYECKKNRSR